MTQDYTAPDGDSRTRHGILARVRVEDYETGTGPPPRAHPARPEAGPPRADPRHRLQPLADLLAQHRGRLAAGRAGARRTSPGARRPTKTAPSTGSGGSSDPAVHAAVTERLGRRPAPDRRRPPPLRDRARLPRRGRRRGPAQLHADGADRARRPRPHRLPHPPPALRLRRRPRAPAARSATACASSSRSRRSTRDELDPAGEEGVGVFGLYDSYHKQRLPPAAQGRRASSTAGSTGKPEAYRRLDAAILETLVLKGLAGMSDDDIAAKRDGLGYAKSVDDALAHARRRRLRRRLHPPPDPGRAGQAPSPKPTRPCRRSRPTSSPRC